jgi:hypothetical protein
MRRVAGSLDPLRQHGYGFVEALKRRRGVEPSATDEDKSIVPGQPVSASGQGTLIEPDELEGGEANAF